MVRLTPTRARTADTSKFAEKVDLASLKLEVDQLNIGKLAEVDVDKLKPIPIDLKKSSHVVDNDVVKKTVYDELVKEVDAIDTGKLVKTKQIMIIRTVVLKVKHQIILLKIRYQRY